MYRLALFFVGLASVVAGAAPVPKEAQTEERFLKLYGTRTGDSKRAKFALDGDRLTAALAAHVVEPQDFFKPPQQPFTPLDAPRVTREIEGDFVARVGIKCPQPPTPTGLGPQVAGGGIVAALGDGHYFTAERYHCLRYDDRDGSKVIWSGSFESTVRKLKPASSRSSYSSHRASIEPLQVRLTRRGNTFTAAASADGNKWEELQTVEVSAPGRLRVGLFARNTNQEAVEVVFAEYTITKPE